MRWGFTLCLLLFFSSTEGWQATSPAALARGVNPGVAVDFSRDIRPILSRKCFPCHGPDAGTRRAELRLDIEEGIRSVHDAAIDANGSELQHRLSTPDPEESMPPPDEADPLEENERALLLAWAAQGAPYQNHWAFEAPTVAKPAAGGEPSIDAFVGARLETAGLTANGRASPETLIRRLHLDLIGLPPAPRRVARFVEEHQTDPEGSWQELVDEVLSSPSYGERWASVWLDLARYADTKGYESDGHRNIWPWRDWLIEALDADVPYDRFTLEMIAGDLIEDADEQSRLATAFHRNAMTNDEGGTQDEEFRVAAVIDRVNTTMQTWMGLTMGCAQCHDHKYDPFSQEEYYRLFAVFNQSADADRNDETPLDTITPVPLRKKIDQARALGEEEKKELSRALTGLGHDDPGPLFDGGWRRQPQETVWAEDGWTPPLATLRAEEKPRRWPWQESEFEPPTGGKVVRVVAPGGEHRQVYFDDSLLRFPAEAGDRLIVLLRTDPDQPPQTVMVQVHCLEGKWEHRAYWGEDAIALGVSGSPSRRHLGDLPAAGEWTRLEIPFDEIGILPDQRVTGVALTHRGGVIEWASVRHRSLRIQDRRFLHSLLEMRGRHLREPSPLVPSFIGELLTAAPGSLSDGDARKLEEWYIANVEEVGRRALDREGSALSESALALIELEAQRISVPVMRELPPGMRRTTHLLRRGYYLDPADEVEGGPPSRLHPAKAEGTFDRLALAHWLISEKNPLTARVHVNRVWEQFFGTGLVETLEDFGTQGSLPSHPQLLDWLAITWREEDRWSQKALLRRIVLSETYRRSSNQSQQQRQVDPLNRFLSRASRIRLPAEVVRDQALALGGILSPKKFGPPVFPPQPPGVWKIVYSGASWRESSGDDRVRRSLYTYWRRTSPYPSLMLFDSPDRGVCRPRRIRTNTPLQALVTLNDPVYIEAATGLARQLVEVSGGVEAALADGFRRVTFRAPASEETQTLLRLYRDQHAAFSTAPEDAGKLLEKGRWNPGDDIDPIDAATMVVIGNVLLNLDEVLVRG